MNTDITDKSDKAAFIIHADFESLIVTIAGSNNYPKISITTKNVSIFHQVFQCLQYHHLTLSWHVLSFNLREKTDNFVVLVCC